MSSRRGVLAGLAGAGLYPRGARAQHAEPSYEQLLANLVAHPEIASGSQAEREGLSTEFDLFATKAIGPRYKPSSLRLPDDVVTMMLTFEVSNAAVYKKLYQHPIWPKGRSGVTIGVGYDLGYAKPAWVSEDWAGILSPIQLSTLSSACGVTGSAANLLIPGFRSVTIEWDSAYRQFINTSLARFTTETLAVLPNATKLPVDCQAALISLVYNRGASFKATGPRYAEMREIRLNLVDEEYGQIPAQFRSMTRLWGRNKTSAGLVYRRRMEAALFARGLKSM